MIKTITRSAIFSSFAFGLFALANQVALAAAKCTVNGQLVDCTELGNKIEGYLGWGIGGLFLIVFLFGIWATVFWIMMIVHAANHNVENRAAWIILMVLTGIVGALVYYFVVKRKLNNQF